MTFETLRWHADTRSHGFYNIFALCYLCAADLSTGCEPHVGLIIAVESQPPICFFPRVPSADNIAGRDAAQHHDPPLLGE